MFKLKLPLLALSMSLLAPQASSAAPLQILPLGDSITNGWLNVGDGKFLGYRDELYDKLKAANYSFDYVGKCPEYSAGDAGGECDLPSEYDGKTIAHEGRAGYHAGAAAGSGINNINDNINSYLGYYYSDIVLLHIGTNDIYQQENDTVKTNTAVEAATYNATLADIEGIMSKINAYYPSAKIYVANILPMGKVLVEGDEDGTLSSRADGDAAVPLNNRINNVAAAWATNYGATVVDMHTGIDLDGNFFQSDLIHPDENAEEEMAQRWFDAISLDFEPNPLAEQTITFNPPESLVFGSDDIDLTAGSLDSSGQPIVGLDYTYAVKNAPSDVCSLDGNTLKIGAQVGNCTIIVNQVGGTDANDVTYAAADDEEETIVIEQAPQTIEFDSTMQTTSSITDIVTAKATGTGDTTLPITFSSKTTTVCDFESANQVKMLAAGTCTIAANKAGSTNYSAATEVTHSIVVANDVITFNPTSVPTKTVGDAAFTVSASAQSGATVTLLSSSTSICTVSGSSVTVIAEGTCILTATAGSASSTLEFDVEQSASDAALDAVQGFIAGTNASVTNSQLTSAGLTGIDSSTDYSAELKGGTYADPSNPTLAEMQAIVDQVNKDAEEVEEETPSESSGGGSIPAWFLALGLVAFFRRKSL